MTPHNWAMRRNDRGNFFSLPNLRAHFMTPTGWLCCICSVARNFLGACALWSNLGCSAGPLSSLGLRLEKSSRKTPPEDGPKKILQATERLFRWKHVFGPQVAAHRSAKPEDPAFHDAMLCGVKTALKDCACPCLELTHRYPVIPQWLARE